MLEAWGTLAAPAMLTQSAMVTYPASKSPAHTTFFPPLILQEVLVKGDKYGASIAWLPADSEGDTPSSQPVKPAPSAPSIAHTSASQLQRQSAGSSEGSSSGSVATNGSALQGEAAGSSTAAGGSSGPGQLPVSSARVASVVVQPDRFPGPSLSLQDFPQQGVLVCSSAHITLA